MCVYGGVAVYRCMIPYQFIYIVSFSLCNLFLGSSVMNWFFGFLVMEDPSLYKCMSVCHIFVRYI